MTDDHRTRLLCKPSAGYALTLRVKIHDRPGELSRLLSRLARLGVSMSEISIVSSDFDFKVRDVGVYCRSEEHILEVLAEVRKVEEITLLDWWDVTFRMHEGGKLALRPGVDIRTADQLAQAYTPGVARVCGAIQADPQQAYRYTIRKNTVAVVTDGSAVLGLGNIGPLAALPVMEGKALLFKQFGGVDAFPICLNTQDPEIIVETVVQLSPTFAGINLEDISAPRCFWIEQALQERLDIPVFHDDQHGTAVVVLAGMLNAMKVVGKRLEDIKVVVNGFGAGGVACARMLMFAGVKNLIACDRAGIIYAGRTDNMNPIKEELACCTNPDKQRGSLADALAGADVFLGLSAAGTVHAGMIRSMAHDPIVFALANPVPEVMPEEIQDIARVIATGRSDYANQVNNVLCFPGIFRGALDCRAPRISQGMKMAAAHAISEAVSAEDLAKGIIIPGVFRADFGAVVAARVRRAAEEEGLARVFKGDVHLFK